MKYLNTSNVTYMSNMFFGCSSLTSLDVSNFDTSNVTSMFEMFYHCSGLTSLDVSNFDTSNVTSMRYMFSGCNDLSSLDVSNFDTSNVTEMDFMFSFCKSLTSLNVSNFDTSNVTDMSNMFEDCSGLTSLDVSNFDTSNVIDMGSMFGGCSGLTSLDLSNFDTSNATNMSWMFSGCSGLTSLDVSNFDTSNVTEIGGLFSGCSGLTSLDVSKFDTSNVTNMWEMFSGCSGLTSLDVSNFDTSNVTYMQSMFSGCSGFTSLDVSNFNTSNVTMMWEMFSGCSGLTNLDLSNFNTSNVIYMGGMFSGCSGLTSLDVSNFNTSNVTSMFKMFYGCSGLTTIYAGDKWKTANVTDGESAFFGCENLVGGKGTKYDAEYVDYTYARIDGGADAPGYFSVKSGVAETCDITIGKNGKTTFCGDKSLDFSYSDEVKAFIATGFDKTEGTIWMTRVKDVPAGVPVMVKGTANETYHVPVTEGGSSYYKNMFVGNTTGESMSIGETSEDGQYVNYYMSGGQFKSVNTSANIGANKCYLQLPATFAAEATGDGCQVKIAASGKSSFAAPCDLDFTSLNDDVKAFTATGYDAGTKTIWLTRVKKVQKGEGLLLKGTGGETYTIPSSDVQAAYENMIVGNIGEEITINGTSEDGTLTNYYLKGGTYMSVSGSANIGTNKSYLQLPTSMLAGTTGARSEDAPYSSDVLGTQENLGYLGNLGMPSTCHLAELETESMPIILQNTTGIKDNNRETITNNRDGQWFTISGQRIDKPTRKGLYIHDGRKVVVR